MSGFFSCPWDWKRIYLSFYAFFDLFKWLCCHNAFKNQTSNITILHWVSCFHDILVSTFQPKVMCSGPFKNDMPVSFKSELFTSYILTIFKQWNLLPKIWETAKYTFHECKILQKKIEFVENVWPANSALFIYVSTYCV